MATALALLAYFWRDWLRIAAGFATSLRDRQVKTADQRLAWLIILATIPVGIAGLLLEHTFRTILGKPIPAAIFLTVNGVILYAGERLRRRDPAQTAPAGHARQMAAVSASQPAAPPAMREQSPGRHAVRQDESEADRAADQRLAGIGYPQAVLIGSVQILALLPGISRSGVTMVAGLARGLSHEDAARFAFLLATPVILAAGALKIPDLAGPLGNGIRGQILAGSLFSGIGAYLSVRFLLRYFQTRTLTPFAIYCTVAGLGSLAYLTLT